MLVGNKSPQWALDLVGKWVIFRDRYQDVNSVKAYIMHTDCFDYAEPSKQVRIFGVIYQDVVEEVRSGTMADDLYSTFIKQGECQVIDTPMGLEGWTSQLRS